LLDYDGTLSPIVKHPDLAFMPPETKEVLERLANRPDVFVAIVSGRGVQDVRSKVGIEGEADHDFRNRDISPGSML
jgi:trehalose 6-phosphate synthase/phosphatase